VVVCVATVDGSDVAEVVLVVEVVPVAGGA
jgi:hypothetical protein